MQAAKEDQFKNEPRSPPALIVARAMPRAKLLSGRGVMENHLPSVLGEKRRFYVESWGGVLTTIKHQLKTEPRSPPALVVARAMPRADRLSGRGSIGHSHPTHLKAKTRFLR